MLLIGGCAQQATSKCSHSSVRTPATHHRGSMLKSGISHSKSCSCGRRELLQKSLNNHVFLLIYSKYLRWEQIKRLEEAANADGAALGMEGWGGGVQREHFCPNQKETILLQLPAYTGLLRLLHLTYLCISDTAGHIKWS